MLFKNGLFGGWGRKAGMPVKKHGPLSAMNAFLPACSIWDHASERPLGEFCMLDIYPWEGAYIWKHEYTTFQPHAAEQRAPDAPWAAPIFVALSGFLSGGGSGCRRFHRKNGPGYRTGPSGCVFQPARRYLPAWTRPIAFHRPQPSAIYVGFYSQALASLIGG